MPLAWQTATKRRAAGSHRLGRAFATVLIALGVGLLADVGITVMWHEPVTGLLSRLSQDGLRADVAKLEHSGPTAGERRILARLGADERRRIAFLARSLRRRTKDGDAVGRIHIARVNASFVVIRGTDAKALRRGPGIYDQTAFPGMPGTTAIAGHRTTYLAPFRHLDRLRRGDPITVQMPYATFVYRVERTRIVRPSALWILHRAGFDRLVLTACHPLFSAAKRIVVFARLARIAHSVRTRT